MRRAPIEWKRYERADGSYGYTNGPISLHVVKTNPVGLPSVRYAAVQAIYYLSPAVEAWLRPLLAENTANNRKSLDHVIEPLLPKR